MASHFRRHIDRQSRQTLAYSLLGIIIILGFLFFYGPTLLNKFVLFISHGQNYKASLNDSGINYIAPPSLDETFTATNSANITVSGYAGKQQNIKLYVDGNYFDQQKSDDNGKFIFENVTLSVGDNDIKAKTITDKQKESAYSNILTITYKNKGPSLAVDSPTDNQTFSGGSNNINVSGKTDPDSKVTVNGFQAIVDSNGGFTYSLQLQNGDNSIKIEAIDSAGNLTDIERKVTYNP